MEIAASVILVQWFPCMRVPLYIEGYRYVGVPLRVPQYIRVARIYGGTSLHRDIFYIYIEVPLYRDTPIYKGTLVYKGILGVPLYMGVSFIYRGTHIYV